MGPGRKVSIRHYSKPLSDNVSSSTTRYLLLSDLLSSGSDSVASRASLVLPVTSGLTHSPFSSMTNRYAYNTFRTFVSHPSRTAVLVSNLFNARSYLLRTIIPARYVTLETLEPAISVLPIYQSYHTTPKLHLHPLLKWQMASSLHLLPLHHHKLPNL